jgi:hypothetical protein
MIKKLWNKIKKYLRIWQDDEAQQAIIDMDRLEEERKIPYKIEPEGGKNGK